MDDEDYLFPKDLRVTDTGFAQILLIGSCQTAQIHRALRRARPDLAIDYQVSNYVGDLPAPEIGTAPYDIVLVQFPLRSIVTDHVVWAQRLADEGFCRSVLETARDTLAAMLEAAVDHAARVGARVFVAGFVVPQLPAAVSHATRGTNGDIATIVEAINGDLRALVKARNDCTFLDLDQLAAAIGKRYVLDDDVYFYGHNALKLNDWVDDEPPGLAIQAIPPMASFYPTKEAILARLILARMEHDVRVERQIDQVKAVIFDLDNTLWRGQIAEDYRDDREAWPQADTWPVGLWEAVHHLKARGILVSLCSKNDHATVAASWHKAVSPAFLQLDDFISPKINWAPKAENILTLLGELNLKAKSVVLVDDNPVERAAVRAALPNLRVIGENPFLTRRILLWSSETQVRNVTRESLGREDAVRGQITREGERAKLGRADFLARLESRITFLDDAARVSERVRILELINRTNQFNTTGERWDGRALDAFTEAGGRVFAFRAVDRFADYGLVGIILLRDGRIEQMVMSCRVIGMDLEIAALRHVIDACRGGGPIEGRIRPTADNAPCRKVFQAAGFSQIGENEAELVYRLAPDTSPVEAAHVTIDSLVDREGVAASV